MIVRVYGLHHPESTTYYLFLEPYGENANTVIAGLDRDLFTVYSASFRFLAAGRSS